MRWTFFIPHTWPEGKRFPWADIWLIPEKDLFQGKSLALTIDALGDPDNPEHGPERREFRIELLEKLGDKDFRVDGADMIVRAVDFSRSEFLDWVKVWIRGLDSEFPELIEGTFETFERTNPVATAADRIRREYPDSAGAAEV